MFLLVSYVSILLLALSSSLIYGSLVNQQITSKTKLSKDLLLTQLRQTWEENSGEVEASVAEFASSYALEQLAKGAQGEWLGEVQGKMSQVRGKDSDFLLDCFVYITREDEVISATQKMSTKRFFDINYRFEDFSVADIRRGWMAPSNFKKYLSVRTVRQYLIADKKILPLIQSFPVSLNKEPLGQIICFVDIDRFTSLMEQLFEATGSSVYVLDKDGRVMISNSGAPVLSKETLADFQQGSYQIAENMVTAQGSSSSPWTFIMATPTKIFHAENSSFQIWMLIISFIYLLVGLVLVWFFTRKSYKPIDEIGTIITSRNETMPKGNNEFDTIRVALMENYDNREKMREILEIQRPYMVREMLQRLISGRVQDYTQWEDRIRQFDVNFEGSSFMVLAVDVDENSLFFEDGPMEESYMLSRLIVQNIGCELLEAHVTCQYLAISRTLSMFLINLPAKVQEDMEKQVFEIANSLAEHAQQFKLRIFGGISSVHQGIQRIPLCYDESDKSLEYSKLWSGKNIVRFKDFEDLDHDYYYPTEIEYQLVGAMRSHNYEAAREIISSVFKTNMQEKTLEVNAARGLLAELGATFDRVLGKGAGSEELYSAALHLEKYMEKPSLRVAQIELEELIQKVEESQQKENIQTKTGKLAENLAVFLQAHVENPNLDLNMLSEEFGLTPQYISNVFKRYNGQNIKDYISEIRLEKAKELLCTTTMPIKEIALTVGYSGEISIIRLFKKYENTTPGEYRNRYKL